MNNEHGRISHINWHLFMFMVCSLWVNVT